MITPNIVKQYHIGYIIGTCHRLGWTWLKLSPLIFDLKYKCSAYAQTTVTEWL